MQHLAGLTHVQCHTPCTLQYTTIGGVDIVSGHALGSSACVNLSQKLQVCKADFCAHQPSVKGKHRWLAAGRPARCAPWLPALPSVQVVWRLPRGAQKLRLSSSIFTSHMVHAGGVRRLPRGAAGRH